MAAIPPRLLFIGVCLGVALGAVRPNMDVPSANNEFAFKLLDVVNEARRNENVLISPVGAGTCVGMLFMRASQEAGRRIAELMHFSLDRSVTARAIHDSLQALDSKSFSWAAGVFVDSDSELSKTSADLLIRDMGATSKKLDFLNSPEQSREEINDWASDHTKGVISELLPEGTITSETVAVLASAVHFKGEWEVSFEPGMTSRQNFNLADGSKKMVEMMGVQWDKFGYDAHSLLKAKILRIPYKDKKQSMVIILPDEKDGLDRVVKQLSGLNFRNEIMDRLDNEMELIVKIPKFSLKDQFNLRHPLEQMGIDLPKSSGATGVYHKTAITVDEKGTEAASASGAVISNSAPPMFLANRPFVFAIVDTHTKTVTFTGIYCSPK